jgi:hypothetical protein
MELPVEIYDRIESSGETFIVVQVLPGRLAVCVKAGDTGGGADQVPLYLLKLPE